MRREQILYGNRRRPHPFRMQLAMVRRKRDDHDLKLFVFSFTSFFVCFYTFLM